MVRPSNTDAFNFHIQEINNLEEKIDNDEKNE